MRGSIEYVVQEPDFTEDFKQLLIIMYDSNWEKRVLTYQTWIVGRLFALLTASGKLTSCMKLAWLNQFNSWFPSQLHDHFKEFAEPGGFLELA